MPMRMRWIGFTRENVEKLPKDLCGAYELANRDKRIVDIGGSRSSNVGIRGRLISHLVNGKYPTAKYFRYEPEGLFDDGVSIEASHSKKYQAKHGRKPIHTKRSPHPIKSVFDIFG